MKLMEHYKLDVFLQSHAVECEKIIKELKTFCAKIDSQIAECVADTYSNEKLVAFKEIEQYLAIKLNQIKKLHEDAKLKHRLYADLDEESFEILESCIEQKKLLAEKEMILNMWKKNFSI